MTRRAIFLDRDGVINQAKVIEGKPYPPASLQELKLLPGVKKALELFKKNNFTLVVVSNQPDVARGTTKLSTVEQINNHLKELLPIDFVIMCYHDNKDNCLCRKPLPGMLYSAAKELTLSLNESFMIGDRWRDVAAGKSAGCKTVFIDYGYNEQQPDSADYKVSSLYEASILITKEELNETG